MDRMVIGIWQGYCHDGDIENNLATTQRVIDEASEAGCDFLCMPEQFLAGSGSRESMVGASMALDDPRLADLAARAADRNVTTLVGLIEQRGDRYANTQVILDGGRLAGHYTKTMLVTGDKLLMPDWTDEELPVFDIRGLRFGIIICHDSSFAEVPATMVWKGAQLIFSPHFNSIPRDAMDTHRVRVRNNHVGIAAHYGVVVARANVVGHWPGNDRYGYGDSAIFAPSGEPLVEAGLFCEKLITADVAPLLNDPRWRMRHELRRATLDQLHAASLAAIEAQEP